VLLHRAYAVQRAQLAKCDGVQFSPDRDSCVFAAKGRAPARAVCAVEGVTRAADRQSAARGHAGTVTRWQGDV
jgi:hypothetical protein